MIELLLCLTLAAKKTLPKPPLTDDKRDASALILGGTRRWIFPNDSYEPNR
jgi:hypothetical protein